MRNLDLRASLVILLREIEHKQQSLYAIAKLQSLAERSAWVYGQPDGVCCGYAGSMRRTFPSISFN